MVPKICYLLTPLGLTTLYQAYYDVYLGGMFFRKLEDLHEIYGMIAVL
jgi:hypothetical protein